MKHFIWLVIIGCMISCGKDEDKVNKEFSKKGTVDLLEEIDKDEYSPPKDGNLTEKQIEMYIKVKEEELIYAKKAAENLEKKSDKIEDKGEDKKPGIKDYMTAIKALGDVADFVTADLRAAKKLGYNAKEFQWVREVIIKTKLAEKMEASKQSANKTFTDMLSRLKQQRDSAKTKEQRDMLDQQIKIISTQIDEMNKTQISDEPITEHNKKLLAKYQDKIVGLEMEFQKWQMLGTKK